MITVKKLEFEVKTIEEAKQLAVEAFRVNAEYLTFEVEEKKQLFGLKKSYHVVASLNVDVLDLGLNLLKSLFENMDVKAQIDADYDEATNQISYTIETDENPVLIGKNGKTLENIQFYLRNVLNIYTEKYVMVIVDIGGYKAHRQKQLEVLATKTAKEVIRTNIPVKLTPMNAFERRIIHTKLADWRDVVTASEGEKPNRYLVIKPRRR